jgi:hypothetical protein
MTTRRRIVLRIPATRSVVAYSPKVLVLICELVNKYSARHPRLAANARFFRAQLREGVACRVAALCSFALTEGTSRRNLLGSTIERAFADKIYQRQ